MAEKWETNSKRADNQGDLDMSVEGAGEASQAINYSQAGELKWRSTGCEPRWRTNRETDKHFVQILEMRPSRLTARLQISKKKRR